jgi:hypothetical protein
VSVILLQDKWRRQPSGPAVLAPEWAKGARFVVSAGSGRVNLANGLPSIPGSRGISPSIGGLGLDYSSTADTPTNTGIDSFESSVNVTIFSCFIVRTAVAWSACIYDRNGWNGGAFGDDGLSYRYVWDGSEWSYSTGLTFGTNRVVAAAHSISANSAICAVDGRTDTRSVSNSARGFQNFANWFGSDPNGGRNLNGVILLAGICVGESWSEPRLREWTRNPWQIVRKQPRILYFTAPSGGGATIAGALESLTLSTFGATVGSSRDVAAALESLALTTSAARVSSDRAITASVESISITTSPARIASDRAVAAATEQLTVTPATASVALVSGIAAGTEALSVTANPATVALAASIAATLEAITVTGLTATVSTSSNTNISAALESITVTVNPATVSRNTALAAALESLTVTPHAASIAVGQIVAAALESLTLTSYPAGIALDVAIAAQLEQINLTTLAAQVGLGTNVAALTEALTLTPHGATLTFAPSVGAATEYITLTTFAAVVGATEAALLSPGLEFTIPLSRLGYTIPLSRVHFTIPQE